jgi:dephospho-CoA kinase
MFPLPDKLVVGITGGIACGKSTVCKKFEELDWQVISTDSLAHEILQFDLEVIDQIVNRFGVEIKDKRGNIDKTQLADVIFFNPSERSWLEQLLHPKVREKWISSINISSQSNFVVEVPLLFENDLHSLFTKTISVHASTNHQFLRLKQRSLSEPEIIARLDSQMSVDEKSSRADFVILGEGDPHFIVQQIKLFLSLL